MKKIHPKTEYSVDALMRNCASTLVRDFQSIFNDPCLFSEFQRACVTGTVARIRELAPAYDDYEDPALFKAAYQLASLTKRHRFTNDLYSDQELIDKAVAGFLETQSRLAELDLDKLDAESSFILDLAAGYVARVLGTYNDEEHRSLCRFGRKASVGIPARAACLAARWELPISGSLEQISWFDSEMSQDLFVQDYWAKQLESDPNRSIYRETSSLTLTLVPKTFKSLRSIMPNTTIGSYMSYGLGEMIRKRLKREGYDIKSLQQRHRYLAHQGSVHGLYATADLSSASDSITDALVKRLLPSDWYDVMSSSRIAKVQLPDDQIVESLTFCTMGIGYTFPLQTLIFLSLLKSIEFFHYGRFDRRTISVYGDDLIYDPRMHGQVVTYFKRFGFLINVEKTFVSGHFRESCGGDYFRGVDVRPFQPRNGQALVGPKAYEAVLYKFINGLLMRWSEYEISSTLDFLVSQLELVAGTCKIVPGDFPDDAGIKCPTLTHWVFLQRARTSHPKYVGHGVYRFSYLRLVPDERKETRHDPYYWDRLRGTTVQVFDYSCTQYREHPTATVALINSVTGVQAESVDSLITRDDKAGSTFRSQLTGRRLRRQSTYVVVNHTGRYMRRSGFSCFENRRLE